MSYYLRAFCVGEAPPPETVERELGVRIDFDVEDYVELRFSEEQLPLVIETFVGADAQAETTEFKELVDDLAESPPKKRVLERLQRATAVVGVQVPSAAVGDEGLAAAGAVVRFLAEHWNALIQADGEGFYEGDRLILELA